MIDIEKVLVEADVMNPNVDAKSLPLPEEQFYDVGQNPKVYMFIIVVSFGYIILLVYFALILCANNADWVVRVQYTTHSDLFGVAKGILSSVVYEFVPCNINITIY